MRLHGADRGDKAEASASLVGVSAVSHPAIADLPFGLSLNHAFEMAR